MERERREKDDNDKRWGKKRETRFLKSCCAQVVEISYRRREAMARAVAIGGYGWCAGHRS